MTTPSTPDTYADDVADNVADGEAEIVDETGVAGEETPLSLADLDSLERELAEVEAGSSAASPTLARLLERAREAQPPD